MKAASKKPYILGSDVLHSFGHLEGEAEEVLGIQGELIDVVCSHVVTQMKGVTCVSELTEYVGVKTLR